VQLFLKSGLATFARILITGILLTGGPLLTFGAAVWWQNYHFREAAASGAMVTWEAQNQFTKVRSAVSLPKAMVGRTWLGQIHEPNVAVPVVDTVKELAGARDNLPAHECRRGHAGGCH